MQIANCKLQIDGRSRVLLLALGLTLCAAPVRAEVPGTMYIFPAGGQRGTTVEFRVGGLELHETTPFEMLGPGVAAEPVIKRAEKTIWFEGPVIPQPESQGQEFYPKDHLGRVAIAADAPGGLRYWRVWNSQGVAPALKFVVGELPEIVEQEQDGEPIPVPVTLPVTINGRIFPREDIDSWSFSAKAGQPVTCEVNSMRLGYPFESRLEILDPAGKPVAEDVGSQQGDAFLRFTPKADGVYQVRIHDISFGGLQHYVYRLTVTAEPFVDRVYPLGGRRGTTAKFELSGQGLPVGPFDIALPAEGAIHQHRLDVSSKLTNPFLLQLDDFPEILEAEPNDEPTAAAIELPAILNGRIERPGDVDTWVVNGKKDAAFDFDVQAGKLGSPLDPVLIISDATGKELTQADDIGPTDSDARFSFKFPADGAYRVQVKERVAARGDARLAYRLRIVPPAAPGFKLRLSADSLTVNRNTQQNFKVIVERLGGFTGEIALTLEGLPDDVTVANDKIAASQNETTLAFKAAEKAKVRIAKLVVRGKAKVGEADVTQLATLPAPRGEIEIDHLLLAVAIPTPFKFFGLFEQKYAPRGAVFPRHYQIVRNGYEGPFTVRMADRQARHLQGVVSGQIDVPAGATGFDYSVYLPPFMEVGRTSRSTVVLEAEVPDFDGTKHQVNFTSVIPEDQIIVLVEPGVLTVEPSKPSYRIAPNGTLEIPFLITRGQPIAGLPVRVELIVPPQTQGVAAEAVTLAEKETTGKLTLKLGGTLGPFNAPLLLRAVALKNGQPVVGEAKVELLEK